jgi:hypothetical protein
MNIKLYSLIIPLALLCLLGANPSAHAQHLHRAEINQPNPGGKDTIIKLEELRRDAKTSEIQVITASGASVPSAMFIMRGCYDIARARNAAFFIQLKEWKAPDGSTHFLVGFTNDNKVNPQAHFDLKDPLPQDDEFTFMAVKELDVLFGDKK